MASPAKKAKTDSLPICPYGARCYRKNTQHFKDFSHSTSDADSSKTAGSSTKVSASDALATVDMSKLPVCKYGASCYRKNLLHFAEFSHPTAVVSKVTSDDDEDTDELSDSDDEKKKDKKDGVKSSDILKRGMSLVKSYSQMSENERKELIKKAFEAKLKLQKELKETQEKMKSKEKELQKLQDQVSTGLLLVDGEKEALDGDKTVYFTLQAERSYKEGSADQTHFRLAESQFYRLLSGPAFASYRVIKVEYVVNPKLVLDFKDAREDLKIHRGEDQSYPVLAFHGTAEQNIKLICEGGFKVPGEKGFKHKTDTGWYGKGVYFSEFPNYSMGYIHGGTKLMLCQVLPGKVFHCTKLIHGAALKSGHDSHTSPDNKELVVFNAHHILPSYIVHYGSAVADFKYAASSSTTKKVAAAAAASSTDVDDIDIYDEKQIADAFNLTNDVKATKAFYGQKIMFSGKFLQNRNHMLDLVMKHGSLKATAKHFTILVVSPDEYSNKTQKVQHAEAIGVPLVGELFVYDCIKAKKLLDTEKYEFEDD